jgi:hypothetical protein
VRGGVVAGLRVHRQQEADRHDEDPEREARCGAAVEAGVVDLVAEDEAGVRVIVGHEDQEGDDHDDADHVPHDRDVVEERDERRREDVQDRVEGEDDQEEQERLAQDVAGVAEVDAKDVEPVELQQGEEERRRAVAHRGDDAEQADDVEPAREPAPAGTAEPCRPPVGSARGREGRRELGHRKGHEQHEGADDRPAEGRRDRAAGIPRLAEGRERPGQDGDDRERDREVREAAPGADQLLLVTKLGEPMLVTLFDSA